MGTTFSTSDIRGRADDTLTTEYVWNIGKAFAEWLSDDGAVALVVGNGINEQTVHAFTEGVLLQGRNVVTVGQGDNQALAAAIADKRAAGGVSITHDGLQGLEVITLFDAQSTPLTTETGLAAIDQLVQAGNFVPAATKGELQSA